MKCPCKECISYAICNSIINDMDSPEVKRLADIRHCLDLFHYLNYEKPFEISRLLSTNEAEIRINTTRQLYGVDSRGWMYER
jgi:hypothetical protein